jgi:dihydrofolate synthase/folylpolyglutamate synthase
VIHGRLERLGENPTVLADVAHNPAGARALAESLPELTGPAPVIGVIGVLADKDAAGMLAELAPALNLAVFTSLPEDALAAWGRPGASAWDPAELQKIAARLNLASETAATPAKALERARELALEAGGAVVITGSHFLLAPGQ